MKICVDENIPLATVSELKALKYDVLDIRQTSDRGMPDDLLWKRATKEGRLLITTDKGFVQHRGETHHGLLIVRLRQPNEKKIHERIMQAIAEFKDEDWNGLTVVMRDAVRSISRSK